MNISSKLTIPKIPSTLYILALSFLLITILGRWRLTPDLGIILYVVGAFIGLYLFPLVERFINSNSETSVTPLRTVLVQGLLVIVALFVLTSTDNELGSGVVLFVNLYLLFAQWQEWKKSGSLAVWFNGSGTDRVRDQRYLYVISAAFILQSVLFILL